MDLEQRAESMTEEARRLPWKAKAALVWIERAIVCATRRGDVALAETLNDYAGCVRAVISKYRREDA